MIRFALIAIALTAISVHGEEGINIDSLQSQVDSIFAAQGVTKQIDSVTVKSMQALAENCRKAGLSETYWRVKHASIKMERKVEDNKPAVKLPNITHQRLKLDI